MVTQVGAHLQEAYSLALSTGDDRPGQTVARLGRADERQCHHFPGRAGICLGRPMCHQAVLGESGGHYPPSMKGGCQTQKLLALQLCRPHQKILDVTIS